ncbi:MAG: type VI secretion system Vgr family protein, partial [Caldimonas sp.]
MDIASTLMPTFAGLAFDSDTRLYRLGGDGALGELLVEAWSLREALDEPWTLELSTLGLDARLDLQALLGAKATLQLALADGRLLARSGIVFSAASGEADGGFARYRLTLRPWTALLAHSRRSRVWQEKTTIEIVENVFAHYAARAQWRWADDVATHLAESPHAGSGERRSYTVQYRETDLAFVTRLLAEEGLGMRLEEDEKAPSGHGLVVFADSPSVASCPEDATSEADGGIRFHRSSAVETRDAVQAFGGLRVLQASTTTTLAWDYATKRAVAASVPTNHDFGGEGAPHLEVYRPARAYAYASADHATRAATLAQEAIEVRNKSWLGRSTVRTLQPGRTFTLTDSPLDDLGPKASASGSGSANDNDRTRFLVTSVVHAGINNLPKELSARLAASSAGGSAAGQLAPWVDAEVRAQAVATGYGNFFESTRAHVPWRPQPQPRPKAPGPLTAEVVGSDSNGGAGGGAEIYTDKLGRICIRHDFQPAGEASTWVRVVQPFAGAGMGLQFIPRIGQQVLVDFFDDDLDRPYVKAALYQGRGEGGVQATPGGQPADSDASVFARSGDASPSGQGNLAGGNSPPWHGAAPGEISAGGQRNAAALSGWKTKEFGGSGFNQLVFDDSNGQLRTQLATSQFATQLNLGHLIHQADNHRGSFRGLGFELRTDAYGTVRGARGVLLSSYGIAPAEPSGDNAAGIALAAQLKTLTSTLSGAAKTHQTVALASAVGSLKATQSVLSDKEAPVPALLTAIRGMVSTESLDAAQADAQSKSTASGDDKVPQLTDPIVMIAAKAGLAIAAGQDVALLAGENLVMAAGEDLQVASGGSARV